MRTTLTLDEDVVRLLEELRKQSGATFKDIVNLALRIGLRGLKQKPSMPHGRPTESVSLGRCRLDNLDNVSEILVFADGENYR